MAELTPKQAEFVAAYLEDLNATRAYLAVYSDVKSNDVARANAARLLAKANVQEAIRAGKAARAERVEIRQDKVLTEIARLAFSDPRSAFNADGSLKPIKEWSDELAASIASIKVKRVLEDGAQTEVAEVKFWDKNSALEKAAKHLGVYEADNKQKNPAWGPDAESRLAYLLGKVGTDGVDGGEAAAP